MISSFPRRFAVHDHACTCGVHAKVDSRENWQKRLWWTGLSKPGRDAVVSLENDLVDHHDTHGDKFVDALMAVHEEHGYISGDDLLRFMRDYLDDVVDASEDRFRRGGEEIGEAALEQAFDRVGLNPAIARTNRLIAYMKFRRFAQPRDDFGGSIDENFRSSFTRVKSLPDDVVADLQQRLRDALITGASTADVLRAMIDRYIDEADPEDIRAALKEIWSKTRSDLQRVIRTETINAYSKAQLQEWYDQGVREVTRHCINDTRTCATCRELCRPGHNVYQIEDLLRLEHPVTEDPENIGQFLTHPHCRDWFEPVLEDVWDEIEDLEREVFADIPGPQARALDVPLDAQQSVKKILKDMEAPETFAFTASITDMPAWQEARLQELTVADPGRAQQRLDEEIRANDVMQWTDPATGVTWIADGAKSVDYITLPFARREGEVFWGENTNARAWWQKRYRDKMAESEMTLEEEGIQIFGGLPFFVPAASASAAAYFAEAYAYYMVDPLVLRALDPQAFQRLKETVFGGQDYIESGGLN